MFDLIKARKNHGYQAIENITEAKILSTHRGFPIIDETKFAGNIDDLMQACPAKAISKNPLAINLGKCIICGECEKMSGGAIKFSSNYKIGCDSEAKLIINSKVSYDDFQNYAIEYRREIHKLFGRSLKLRQVSAGGCNGCEMELNACGNVNFDMGRFGIDFVASPRHADGIVLTGPITKNMAKALEDAYQSIGDPKIVIATGACAISGGIFADSTEIDRTFTEKIKIDLFIPGCPPHPLVIINAILKFLGKK
ncbi:NADH:ubiquinone oxidoreductase [Melioribacter sp. OK-6-Me]|uniref:NADH-quinone oxidoreductase subunit B family protein n=1 Tax=unclassified Melioribacter TaxID=2627329 RepID=UPI003EDAF027